MDLEEKAVKAYMFYFSPSEGSEIIDFFETPAGKIWALAKIARASKIAQPSAYKMAKVESRYFENFMQKKGGWKFATFGSLPIKDVFQKFVQPMVKSALEKCP
jgi:hypothetical protein